MNRLFFQISILALMSSPALANMSGDEIKSELIGKNLSWSQGNYSGTAYYAANGTARLTMKNSKIKSDTGKWTLKGNKICLTWKKVRSGKTLCTTVNKTGDGKYKYSSGVLVTRR